MPHKPSTLANLGATCYINTTIQCLGHCRPFLEFILSHKSNDTLIGELAELYRELFIGHHSLIPRKFINALKSNITSIEINEQNDINEFLIIFLDKINRNIAVVRPIENNNKMAGDQFSVLNRLMENAWNSQTSKEYSSLVPMFYGQLISQINCGCCMKIHHNYELFSDLSVPISDNCNTLYDCLDEHFKDEIVNTDEKLWTCDKCKNKYESNKCVLMWRSPQILIISLKRFSVQTMRKNAKNIKIPETLDISKYCLKNKNNIYKLVAAGIHMGFSQLGGHYYAVCRGYDGNWYKIDDLDVRAEKEVNVENGYVYFYVLT